MTTKKRPYKAILKENPDVRRWYVNMSQGSEITADVKLRALIRFCREVGITPDGLLKMDSKALQNLLIDYVERKNKETFIHQKGSKKGKEGHYTGSYIFSNIKAVKSWLAFNDITIKKIKVRGSTSRPTLDTEKIPSQAQLKLIIMAAPTMRDRVSCLLVAHGGLRLQTLGNYNGTDGLRFLDFPEMFIKDNKVEFKAIPTKIIVRENLSKARHQYFTFLGEEGCEYLKAYLEYRMNQGEILTPESDIIHAKVRSKSFITTINVGDGIRTAIKNAGFNQRPYVLRSFFATQTMFAEGKGKIIPQYRQFFMGHAGDMEARYTTNKKCLPDEIIEDMREAYKRAQPFLQTNNPGLSEDQVKLNLRRQMLTLLRFSSEQLDNMNLEQKTDEEIEAIIRAKVTAVMANNGNFEKTIEVDELQKYQDEGWEYHANLPNGKVVVKLPR